jgi:hypothetical protein
MAKGEVSGIFRKRTKKHGKAIKRKQKRNPRKDYGGGGR